MPSKKEEKRGKTFVCDDEKCVMGNFKPMGTGTAHQRLAKAAGIDPDIGGRRIDQA
jgi:hypothetical protein